MKALNKNLRNCPLNYFVSYLIIFNYILIVIYNLVFFFNLVLLSYVVRKNELF